MRAESGRQNRSPLGRIAEELRPAKAPRQRGSIARPLALVALLSGLVSAFPLGAQRTPAEIFSDDFESGSPLAWTLCQPLPCSFVVTAIDGNVAGESSVVAEIIGSADGSVLPGGAAARNEIWLRPQLATDGGSLAISLGGRSPLVVWTLLAGDTDCIEQYDGSSWPSFAAVGAGSGAGSQGFARFRATEATPFSGCTAVLRPECVSASGGTCAMSVSYTDITFAARHGIILDFFIQAPGRTCVDGEPMDFTLPRYSTASGAPPGVAADFFVCALTSFGTWLRYDVVAGDGSGNDDIDWFTTPGTLLEDGGAVGSMSDDGYVRYNTTSSDTSSTLSALHASAFAADSITIHRLTDVVTMLEIASPNSLASASPSCLGLPAAPPGAGGVEACLLRRQAEEVRITGTGPGISGSIDLSTDHLVELAVTGGSCGVATTGPLGRTLVAGSPASSPAGYCTTVVEASVNVPLGNVTSSTIDLAVLTGSIVDFSTSTPILTLDAVVETEVLRTTASAQTGSGPVTVDTSSWSVGASAGLAVGLEVTGPVAAFPWTSRYWTEPPAGIVTTGGEDLARPGTREFGMLTGGPLLAASATQAMARIPDAQPVSVTVTVNP